MRVAQTQPHWAWLHRKEKAVSPWLAMPQSRGSELWAPGRGAKQTTLKHRFKFCGPSVPSRPGAPPPPLALFLEGSGFLPARLGCPLLLSFVSLGVPAGPQHWSQNILIVPCLSLPLGWDSNSGDPVSLFTAVTPLDPKSHWLHALGWRETLA